MSHRHRKGHRHHKHGRRKGGSYSTPWVLWDGIEQEAPKKPRVPRKKKEPQLGTIADVTARPVRKIRIVKE